MVSFGKCHLRAAPGQEADGHRGGDGGCISELPEPPALPRLGRLTSTGSGLDAGLWKAHSWVGQQQRKQGSRGHRGWPQVSSPQGPRAKVDLTGQGWFCCLAPPMPCSLEEALAG